MDNQDATPFVAVHINAIGTRIRERPMPVGHLRAEVESLLVFLTSAEGRTDPNCWAVDWALNNSGLWEAIDEIEPPDVVLADVLRDMAGTLHDTVSAPDIAANFDSTPEQLLSRLPDGQSA